MTELFSNEWCEKATDLWNEVTLASFEHPHQFNYVVEWGDTDTGSVCQCKAQEGKIVTWEPGKAYSDDECDFIIWASREVWQKVGEGKLDPVGAVAAKLVHMRKGPMPVVIKEADAFKKTLVGFAKIPTAWGFTR